MPEVTMRSLYNFLFLIFFVLSSPYYFSRMRRRGDWRRGFRQRFGIYDNDLKQAITNRQVIWLHAVSVGEVNVCIELIRALELRLPNAKFMVSTTTTTGMGELRKKMPAYIGKMYYPIDRRKFVARALGTIHPDAVILVEAEIWPNFIWRARARGTLLFLVNARLSDRSYPRYKRFGALFRQLFASFAGVGAQTEEYAAKLTEVGCRPENVGVTGNLKFDAALLGVRRAADVAGLLAQVGVAKNVPVLVAGSTHDGEEDLLADQVLRLRARFPGLFLVLVPRHFERASDVEQQLAARGMRLFRRTEITRETRLQPGSVDCLLVDTTGELMSFYQAASVVFVGKSLSAKGGQNPIEPAALGKAVVFGPNMQNFADVARMLVSQGGAIQVRDPADLEQTVAGLLADPERCEKLGARARTIVEENRGSVARTVEMILSRLDAGKTYIAPAKPQAARD
jgi:3-deoxy-D-manno-octulosonic-acid transferase